MYSTSVYYYIPRQIVVLNFGNSVRRYQTVYAKNLKLHKGVDNKLQFQFINQEQRPVNVTGKEITLRLISYDGTKVLLQKSLTPVLPATGIMELQTSAAEIEDIDSQLCSYSLEIPVGSFDLPVFVDSDAGARGTIGIVNSVLPKHLPSQEVTIPSHPVANAQNTVTYYSSVVNTMDNPLLTLQTYYTNYSGSVQLQGSTLPDQDWYDIGNVFTYNNTSTTSGYVVNGFHPYIRVKFVSVAGAADKIYAR